MNEVSTRTGKLTEKGRAYRTTLLKERRENRITVEEELAQFKNLFKMLLNIHEEYSEVLDDERAGEDDWFDDLGDKVRTLKR